MWFWRGGGGDRMIFGGNTQYIRFIAHSAPVWFLAVAAEFPAWRHHSKCYTSLKAWLVSQSSVVGIRTFCQTIAKWCKLKCWEWVSEPFPVCVAIGTVFNFDCYGLFTLPGTDSDPDPGTDIHHKNGYSNDQGSRSRLNSESESVQWEQCSVQYNVTVRFGVRIRVRIRQCK